MVCVVHSRRLIYVLLVLAICLVTGSLPRRLSPGRCRCLLRVLGSYLLVTHLGTPLYKSMTTDVLLRPVVCGQSAMVWHDDPSVLIDTWHQRSRTVSEGLPVGVWYSHLAGAAAKAMWLFRFGPRGTWATPLPCRPSPVDSNCCHRSPITRYCRRACTCCYQCSGRLSACLSRVSCSTGRQPASRSRINHVVSRVRTQHYVGGEGGLVDSR